MRALKLLEQATTYLPFCFDAVPLSSKCVIIPGSEASGLFTFGIVFALIYLCVLVVYVPFCTGLFPEASDLSMSKLGIVGLPNIVRLARYLGMLVAF